MLSSCSVVAMIVEVALHGNLMAAQPAHQLAEVEWIQPRPSGNQINAIATRGSRWVAVGDAGTVTVSIDAGATWRARSTATLEPLRHVLFLDSMRMLAMGEGGVMLESADAGRTWEPRSSGTTNQIRAATVSGKTLIIVGAGGMIRRLNPAAKWESRVSGVTTMLRGLAAPPSNALVAVGDGGTIVRSSNGGTTWRRVETNTGATLRAVLFTNGRDGVVVGGDDRVWRSRRVVLFTRDGGVTWRKAAVPRGGRLYALAADAKRIVAVGEGGAVIETRDHGGTWSTVPHKGSVWLAAAALPNERGIVALGERGTIVRTDDAGKTWTPPRDGSAAALAALAHPAPGVIFVSSATQLLRSANGGATFVQPQLADSSQGIWRVHFADSRRGVAVGSRGLVLRSSDNGMTWSKPRRLPSSVLWGVKHVAGATWFAVGSPRTGTPVIFRSDDNGATWTGCSCPARGPMYDLHFKGRVGMISGARGVILRTTDEGRTWTRLRQNHTRAALRGVAVVDSVTAIVVGLSGSVLRTGDGGNTWARVAMGVQQRLHAVDVTDSTVVAVGAQGSMVLSRDAGLTWRAVRLPVATDLRNVSLINANEALATGIPIGIVRLRFKDTAAAPKQQSEPRPDE